MNPNTAEVVQMIEEVSYSASWLKNPHREETYWGRTPREPEEGFEEIKGFISPEEIERGYANFDTWCRETNRTLNTRQTRRKAERDYKKALKRYKRIKQ